MRRALEYAAGPDWRVMAYTPLQCRRAVVGPDGAPRQVQECIQVLVYLAAIPANARAPIVKVYPGVTGHESFYVESMRENLTRGRVEYEPKESLFGGLTAFEHEDVVFCAGSAVYARLWSSVGEFEEALAELEAEVARVARQEAG